MEDSHEVRIDLDPMHKQVGANLMLLRAAKQTDATRKAIAAFERVEAALVNICDQMGVRVTFA